MLLPIGAACIWVCAATTAKADPASVTTPNAPSLLRVNTENPRYFMDQTGKAVYLTGSHVWLNLQDLSHYPPFDNTAYLNMMVANGHNFIRLWTLDESNIILYPDGFRNNVTPIPFTRSGPGTAADSGLKVNLAQLSQDYYDRLRARVIEARDRGIYVSIMLFNGLWIDGPDSTQFTYSYFNPANNMSGPAVKKDDLYTMNNSSWVAYTDAYVDKVVDTVNDLDNVLYEVSNETTVKSKSWQYHVIDRIHAREAGKPKQHPVGITAFSFPSGGESNNQYLYASNAEWVSIFGNVNYTTYIPDAPATKVEILDTDHVWGLDPPGDDSPWVWKSLTRGHNPIYMDPYTYASGQPPDASPRTVMDYARNLAGWIRKSLRRGQNPTDISGHPPDISLRAAMGYARAVANRLDLNHMVPNDALASTGYVLAHPNIEYLVYQPSNAAFTVNLPTDTFSYEWICPNTGATSNTGNFTSTAGSRTFALPDGCNSALLYLKSRTAPTDTLQTPANFQVLSVHEASRRR
jgi:hypothetical protein